MPDEAQRSVAAGAEGSPAAPPAPPPIGAMRASGVWISPPSATFTTYGGSRAWPLDGSVTTASTNAWVFNLWRGDDDLMRPPTRRRLSIYGTGQTRLTPASPEDQARLNALQQRENERAARRETARTSAIERARATLLRWLTPEQRASYEHDGTFRVTGSAGGTYRIRPGSNGNVDWFAPDNLREPAARLCAHPALYTPGDDLGVGLPNADIALAQLLHLMTDEPGWLRLCNVHWAAPGRDFQQFMLRVVDGRVPQEEVAIPA